MPVTSQRKYNNYYYKTMNDAIKDERLMTAEIWQVDFRKEFAIFYFSTRESDRAIFQGRQSYQI